MTRRTTPDIAPRLRAWYLRHRRTLPWRDTRDPYRIWISEVMLQQTRVETVIPYYSRFIASFPDAGALAAAREDDVLRAWAGLGYYSRGRNLLHAAREIVRDHGGSLPGDVAALRALPGVGEYTAHAVASIAFGLPHAVIDGNVERVLCRILARGGDPRRGATRALLERAAEESLDRRHPGDHNQALMELGATVCTPRDPRCGECPLADLCEARARGTPERYPAARRRRTPEDQHWIAAVGRYRGTFLLVENAAGGELLAGHWGFPLARWTAAGVPSTAETVRRARALARQCYGKKHKGTARAAALVRHTITHRRLWLYPVEFEFESPPIAAQPTRAIPPSEAHALPALYRKLCARHG